MGDRAELEQAVLRPAAVAQQSGLEQGAEQQIPGPPGPAAGGGELADQIATIVAVATPAADPRIDRPRDGMKQRIDRAQRADGQHVEAFQRELIGCPSPQLAIEELDRCAGNEAGDRVIQRMVGRTQGETGEWMTAGDPAAGGDATRGVAVVRRGRRHRRLGRCRHIGQLGARTQERKTARCCLRSREVTGIQAVAQQILGDLDRASLLRPRQAGDGRILGRILPSASSRPRRRTD